MSLPLKRRIVQAAFVVAAGAVPALLAGSASAATALPNVQDLGGLSQLDSGGLGGNAQSATHEAGQLAGSGAATTVGTAVPALADATGATAGRAIPASSDMLGTATQQAGHVAGATTGSTGNLSGVSGLSGLTGLTGTGPTRAMPVGAVPQAAQAPAAAVPAAAPASAPAPAAAPAAPASPLSTVTGALPPETLPLGPVGSVAEGNPTQRLGGLPSLGDTSGLGGLTHTLPISSLGGLPGLS